MELVRHNKIYNKNKYNFQWLLWFTKNIQVKIRSRNCLGKATYEPLCICMQADM
jgi:hypothetical protein